MQTTLNPVADAMVRPIDKQFGAPEQTALRTAAETWGSR
jgi:hypothetical protein